MATRGNHDVLPASQHVSHRRGLPSGGQSLLPDFFAGFGVEGANEVVCRRTDENQATGRGDGAAHVRRALNAPEGPGCDVARGTERPLPADFAAAKIQSDELAPRGPRAGNA